MIADAVENARDPWWLIGSAAVALHGADLTVASDVDLLMSENDAAGLLQALGLPPIRKAPHPTFRSTVFGRWDEPPLPVEIMGGFEFAAEDGWERVWPLSRQRVLVGGHALFVPSAGELGAILLKFGRPKDLDRARLLAR
jgi:hypothetical protein